MSRRPSGRTLTCLNVITFHRSIGGQFAATSKRLKRIDIYIDLTAILS